MAHFNLSFHIQPDHPPSMCIRPASSGDLTSTLHSITDMEREVRAMQAELEIVLQEARRRMEEWQKTDNKRKAGEGPSLF